ncbi:hypothetical protein AAK979_06010, partial [Ileibacterium valens]|uniref:hypothetical protein n=1 Tax=Ileibacterium valens TaxID=1862668 RepID=UPI003514673A
KSSSFVVDNLTTVTGGFNPVKYKELTMFGCRSIQEYKSREISSYKTKEEPLCCFHFLDI